MRFQVLGAVTAHAEQGPVDLGAARQRAVLAVLLVEPGRPVSVEQLVDRVWAAAPPRQARRTLQSYLSRLRHLTSGARGPVLAKRGASYVLEVDRSAVDMHRFRALVSEARKESDDDHAATLWRDALALWRGTPFTGLESEWLQTVGIGLEAERWSATLDHFDLRLRRNEHAELLSELVAAAGEHPLDERLAGQLMLALYRCGRQGDALACYRSLHGRLIDEIGSAPGAALQELHQRILQQDPALVSAVDRAAASVTAASRPPARAAESAQEPSTDLCPAQLPADVPGFIGRKGALGQLDALLAEGGDSASTVVISAIGGCAGIGKTALAVHWAHRVRDRFPDGQLYLNLRGFDPGGQVMGAAEALRALLELLQVPAARIPTTTEGQIGLYRSRLAGARMLVVLDNARDTEQVRPLLPGVGGSVVLVTSRDRLAGLIVAEGARPVQLDVLDDDEAWALLAGRLGVDRVAAQPTATEQIIQACAGLPLALAIVAARAAAQPTFPLAVYAEELADDRHRLDALANPDPLTDVRKVFSWSYEALSPPAARLFRQLGLHPGPDVSLAAAASLAGLPAPATRRLLGELTNAHLLTEHVPGRYASHDLLRAYAAERAGDDPESERRAARHRLLDHYLHSAYAADRWLPAIRDPITLSPPRPGVLMVEVATNTAARQWLTSELPAILACLQQATAADWDHHVQQLAWTLATFLLGQGRLPEQATVQKAGLCAARRRGDRAALPGFHNRLAHALIQLGRHDEARAHLHESLDLCRETGEADDEARTHMVLVWLYEKEGCYRDGLGHAWQCLESARAADNRTMQAIARNAIGWCHVMLGEYEVAIGHCEQALAELEELGSVVGQTDVWDSLGHAHRGLGQYRQAIDYHQRAVRRCRELGDRRQEATYLVGLGETHHVAGERDAGLRAWRRALEIFDDVGHPDADDLRKRLETVD